MLRIVKIVLVATVAAFVFISGIFDLLNWGSTVGYVGMVTSMTAWQGGAASWKAVSSAPLSWLGAIWIIGGDLAAAGLCGVSVARMWRARNASDGEFASAKKLALVGCGILAIMLFGGFNVLAEAWFELWRSDAMRGPVLDTVYRYLGSILLIAVFVASKEPE
jgi:predicted small integral membrane protein